MAPARSGEIDEPVEKSRPFNCGGGACRWQGRCSSARRALRTSDGHGACRWIRRRHHARLADRRLFDCLWWRNDVTDGYIVNGRHNLSPDLNGPTCGGMAYDVVKKVVKPGDIIIVPAGVVHGWLEISDHVEYLSFRPSPGILTAGWAHPVLKK
jgi:Cupin